MSAPERRRPSRAGLALLGVTAVATVIAGVAQSGSDLRGAEDPVAHLASAAVVTPMEPSRPAIPTPDLVAAQASGPQPDPAWVQTVGQNSGIGATALAAYAAADLRLQEEQRRCGLSWATLAGIGWIESQHGTVGGRTVGSDGRSGPTAIFGVALTGAGQVAMIPDTDEGRLDRDPSYDRAVGPMQFVPGTWRTWASDGDGDGVADPQDIDDAAYSAARYLCAAGVPLDSATAWTSAVLSYNRSLTYLRDVLAATNAYATRSAG